MLNSLSSFISNIYVETVKNLSEKPIKVCGTSFSLPEKNCSENFFSARKLLGSPENLKEPSETFKEAKGATDKIAQRLIEQASKFAMLQIMYSVSGIDIEDSVTEIIKVISEESLRKTKLFKGKFFNNVSSPIIWDAFVERFGKAMSAWGKFKAYFCYLFLWKWTALIPKAVKENIFELIGFLRKNATENAIESGAIVKFLIDGKNQLEGLLTAYNGAATLEKGFGAQTPILLERRNRCVENHFNPSHLLSEAVDWVKVEERHAILYEKMGVFISRNLVDIDLELGWFLNWFLNACCRYKIPRVLPDILKSAKTGLESSVQGWSAILKITNQIHEVILTLREILTSGKITDTPQEADNYDHFAEQVVKFCRCFQCDDNTIKSVLDRQGKLPKTPLSIKAFLEALQKPSEKLESVFYIDSILNTALVETLRDGVAVLLEECKKEERVELLVSPVFSCISAFFEYEKTKIFELKNTFGITSVKLKKDIEELIEAAVRSRLEALKGGKEAAQDQNFIDAQKIEEGKKAECLTILGALKGVAEEKLSKVLEDFKRFLQNQALFFASDRSLPKVEKAMLHSAFYETSAGFLDLTKAFKSYISSLERNSEKKTQTKKLEETIKEEKLKNSEGLKNLVDQTGKAFAAFKSTDYQENLQSVVDLDIKIKKMIVLDTEILSYKDNKFDWFYIQYRKIMRIYSEVFPKDSDKINKVKELLLLRFFNSEVIGNVADIFSSDLADFIINRECELYVISGNLRQFHDIWIGPVNQEETKSSDALKEAHDGLLEQITKVKGAVERVRTAQIPCIGILDITGRVDNSFESTFTKIAERGFELLRSGLTNSCKMLITEKNYKALAGDPVLVRYLPEIFARVILAR